MLRPPRIRLPKTWPANALRSVLHALSAHRMIFAIVRSKYGKAKLAFEHASRLGRMNTLRDVNEILTVL